MFSISLNRIYGDGQNFGYNPHGRITQVFFWARHLTEEETYSHHKCDQKLSKTGYKVSEEILSIKHTSKEFD